MTSLPAELSSRYQVLTVVGSGAMGTVLEARDRELDRAVAIKLTRHQDSPELIARMQREAAALARLRHPNLVEVYDHGGNAAVAWIVMELVEGRPLGSPETEHDPLPLLLDVAGALEACHAAGIVHRDLKPSNVVVDAAGAPRLLDFGLARDADADRTRLTHSQNIVGTLAYLAPEIIQGEEAGPAADFYAWGLALVSCLEGDLPTTPGIAPRRLSLSPQTEARGLRPLLEACLQEDPADRPTTRAALEALCTPSPPPPPAQVAPPRRPFPVVLPLAGVVAACFTALLVLAPARGPEPRSEELPSTEVTLVDPLTETPLRWDPADPPGLLRHRSSWERLVLAPGLGPGGADLAVSRSEVLVEHYERFLDERDAPPPKAWEVQRACPRCPVAALSLEQMRAYARWARGRLPTCDEWETLAGPAIYPWGDEPPTDLHANWGNPLTPIERGHFGYLRPAGSFLAGTGPAGMLDLAGNVSEVCRAAAHADGWLLKGGDWNSHAPEALSVRHDQEPNQAFRSALRMIEFRPRDAEGPLRGSGPKLAAALEYGEADLGMRLVWDLPAGTAEAHRKVARARGAAGWSGLPFPP